MNWRAVVPMGVAIALALLPVPAGLTRNAWLYFSLFAGVVTGLVLEPIPAAGVGFVGMALMAASRLAAPDTEASLKLALSGFANGTVWLVFAAFTFALGYQKTGLGKRIALLLVRRLGGRTLGLGYAVMLADVVLAPFTPSNTARSAGTVFPVIRNIPPLYDSHPGPTARRIGAYIIWTEFAATAVTSSMFLTGLAPNLLAVSLVEKTIGHDISMGTWVIGFLPIGLLFIAVLPWLVYKIYPPTVTGGHEVPEWAGAELARMGRVSRGEWTMGGLALVAISLWVLGGELMEAATAALLVISLMLAFRIVTWQEIVGHKDAWNVLVLLATLVGLADGLNKVGFVGWLARGSAALLGGLPPTLVMAALVAVFFVTHYMFASITAHVTAMLPMFLAAGVAVPGMPVNAFALLLCYSLGVMGILTPYATGPAPVFYASGFVSRKEFWTLGLIFGAIFLAALLGIGIPYLMLLHPMQPVS
ncbi:MAG TPA: DASS family sodium-coupled anion symporter [Vicinamibacterales bacterium]